MIEVEKKFILNDKDRIKLTKDAQFLNECVFTDIYYDTDDYALTTKDTWLRSREGRFELKIPLHKNAERLADQYDEIEDEGTIRKFLELPSDQKLFSALEKNGYRPFCVYKTTRKKYSKTAFIIDLDTVEFESFTYSIGEIELMVDDKSQIEDAIQKIMEFAKNNGLRIAPVRGKVIEFLRKVKPEHYRALIKAGVVKE